MKVSVRTWMIIMPLVLVLSACQPEQKAKGFDNYADISTEPILVRSYGSYASIPIDTQIEEADIIFAGTITSVSKTRWNQDSGEFWEEVVETENGVIRDSALPYYTIELVVNRPIINSQQGETLISTVVGTSPLDESPDEKDAHEYSLQVGDEVVIFVSYSEMAWRGGKRPILHLMAAPENSCFVRGKDGLYRTTQRDAENRKEESLSLDGLIARIDRVRSMQ